MPRSSLGQKYSRDAENQLDNQVERAENEDDDIAEFEGMKPIFSAILDEYLPLDEQKNIKETVRQQLNDTVKDFSKPVDPVQLDRAFADLPLAKKIRVVFNTKYVQNHEHDKNYYAVRCEHARRCFINDSRIKECVAKYVHEYAKQVRMAKAAQGTLPRSRGTGNQRGVQQTDSKSVVAPSLGEYKGIKEQFDKLAEKHSRDVSAFSFGENPLSEQPLKAKAELETPLGKLEKANSQIIEEIVADAMSSFESAEQIMRAIERCSHDMNVSLWSKNGSSKAPRHNRQPATPMIRQNGSSKAPRHHRQPAVPMICQNGSSKALKPNRQSAAPMVRQPSQPFWQVSFP